MLDLLGCGLAVLALHLGEINELCSQSVVSAGVQEEL